MAPLVNNSRLKGPREHGTPRWATFSKALRRVLFRPWLKSPRLQTIWSRLHTLSLFGMNYGGGGDIRTSGEEWLLRDVVAPRCASGEGIVLDVGANTGEYALLVARLLPGVRVFAFEPVSQSYESLRAKLRQAGTLGQAIEALRLGMSDASGVRSVNIYAFATGPASQLASVEHRRPTADVEMRHVASEPASFTTLDEFIAERGIGRIALLKIDVEGHELAVLRGGRQTLARGRIDIVQFEVSPATLAAGCSFWQFWELLSPRYEMYRVLPDGVARLSRYHEKDEVFLTTNYMAVLRQTTPAGGGV